MRRVGRTWRSLSGSVESPARGRSPRMPAQRVGLPGRWRQRLRAAGARRIPLQFSPRYGAARPIAGLSLPATRGASDGLLATQSASAPSGERRFVKILGLWAGNEVDDHPLLMRAGAGRGALFQQRNQCGGDEQHDAEQCEAIGVAHDRRLRPDCVTDGDDGAVHGARRIGETV